MESTMNLILSILLIYSIDAIKITERHGRKSNYQRVLTFDEDGLISSIDSSDINNDINNTKKESRLINFKGSSLLQDMFLPKGFPDTVPQEYSRFQILNIAQDFCSYLRGIISVAAILKGFGVGDEKQSATAAALNWIYRDGASMIGGLLFSAIARFDTNIKSYRFFADLINNLGLTLDVLACIGPSSLFLPLICFASVCKSLCGVAAGAAGGAITMHLASKAKNIGDVLAKNGAQHTAVNLVGLGLSHYVTRFIGNDSGNIRLLSSFSILTLLHIILNYKAMQTLALTSINQARLKVLIKTYLNNNNINNNNNGSNGNNDMNLYTPAVVAKQESILGPIIPKWIPRLQSTDAYDRIELFASPIEVAQSLGADVFTSTIKSHMNNNGNNKEYYLFNIGNKIAILFKENISPKTILKAALHASLSAEYGPIKQSQAEEHYQRFYNLLQVSGWSLSDIILEPNDAIYFISK